MVAQFKTEAGTSDVHETNRDTVEDLLGRRLPWLRPGRTRGRENHFALCPYCENPIQITGLYASENRNPYGSHANIAVEGFGFDSTALEFCPYKRQGQRFEKTARRPQSELALRLIRLAVSEFDRIVSILREDLGFGFSHAFARVMLEQWFDSAGYLYAGANLRNLPWIIAYLSRAQPLFGQYIGSNEELRRSIIAKVPNTNISSKGQLVRGAAFLRMEMQCLRHRVSFRNERSAIAESMLVRVQDFTKTNEPSQAPKIYSKTIVFEPERFEALIRTPVEQARRDGVLLDIARSVAHERRMPCA